MSVDSQKRGYQCQGMATLNTFTVWQTDEGDLLPLGSMTAPEKHA